VHSLAMLCKAGAAMTLLWPLLAAPVPK